MDEFKNPAQNAPAHEQERMQAETSLWLARLVGDARGFYTRRTNHHESLQAPSTLRETSSID